VRCQYGWACFDRHDIDAAFEQFGAVLGMLPNHAEACAGMASCCTDIGDIDSARQWLDRTLQTDPAYAGAYRDLANLKCLTPDDHRFAQLVRLTSARGQPSRRRSILNMALGEAYRLVGDTEKAFAHYDLGNALKDVTFDIETHRGYLDRVMRYFNPAHFERVAGKGVASEFPVFIVGMTRSGTSLIEQIIASHPAVHGAGERDDIFQLAENLPEVIGANAPFPECVAQLQPDDVGVLAAEQLDHLRSIAPDKARITDKMPSNFMYLGLIATFFPNARIIHCRRDPLDVCLSIYFGEFGGHHPHAYDLEHLGLFYREYERIMEYWSHTLPLRIFDVRYEDVVDDVEGMTRRLIEFCGLPWDDRCLEFHKNERAVHTRSRLQVRQPIYRSSRGRWRPYARYLAPLADALGGEHPARLHAELNP
jgi:tetratricopeptide (TPR) repeat protein